MGDWDYLRGQLSRGAEAVKASAKKSLRNSGDGIRRLHEDRSAEKLGSRFQDLLEKNGKRLEQSSPELEVKIQALLQAKSDKPAKLIAAGISGLGRRMSKFAPFLGATTTGAGNGLIEAGGGLCDLSISNKDLADMEARCEAAAHEAERIASHQHLIIRRAVETDDKKQLLDTLTVGGITLAAAMQNPSSIPSDIEEAYALAYPRMADEGITFSEAIAGKSPEELVGLVSGVKGKLFEIQLVDQLNDGQLADGFHAVLASSPTQTGYDIQILDRDGEVSEELQAKATESVAYVREALERYPGVDVVTTSEVYGELFNSGIAAGITDSGISEKSLHDAVHGAVSANPEIGLADFAPSALGLALIALSTFRKKEIPLEERGALFGHRSAGVTVASSLGAGTLFLTGLGALGVIVGIGSHVAAGEGSKRRQRYETLKAISTKLEESNRRNETSLAQSVSQGSSPLRGVT